MAGRGWIGLGVVACLGWSSACVDAQDVGAEAVAGRISPADVTTKPARLDTLACGDDGAAASPVTRFTDLTSDLAPALYGVWEASPDDVWAVGAGGTALHYDGHAVAAAPIGEDVTLYDVWGTAANQVWAVGEGGTAVRWTGRGWVPFATGTLSTLRAVFASAPDDVWLGGEFGSLLRFDGLRSTPVTVPGVDAKATITDIRGTGPNDVWIISAHGGGAFASHFDGSSWSAPESFDEVGADRVWAKSSRDEWLPPEYCSNQDS